MGRTGEGPEAWVGFAAGWSTPVTRVMQTARFADNSDKVAIVGAPVNADQYLHKIYVTGDRTMLAVLWAVCLMSVAMAAWHDTWWLALLVSVPGTITVTVVVLLVQGSLAARLLNAAAFMCMAAMIIHQGHGMIELHFGIFCELAFLIVLPGLATRGPSLVRGGSPP